MPGNGEWRSQDIAETDMAVSGICDAYPKLHDMAPGGAESRHDDDNDTDDDDDNINHNQS